MCVYCVCVCVCVCNCVCVCVCVSAQGVNTKGTAPDFSAFCSAFSVGNLKGLKTWSLVWKSFIRCVCVYFCVYVSVLKGCVCVCVCVCICAEGLPCGSDPI